MRFLPLLLSGALLAGCGGEVTPAPDSIFVGRILTLDPIQPATGAIAVLDGRIVATGERETVTALAGSRTQIVELPGVAVPGWIDAHVHVSGLGKFLETLNVQGLNKRQIREKVAALAAGSAPGEWIVGQGWDEGYFDTRADPTAADLDSVSPGNPVVLAGIGGHSVWVNSRALQEAGIRADTPDPAGGRIVRDVSGRATGLLLERAEDLVQAVMPKSDAPAALERQMRAALAQYARWGLTGVHDAGVGLEEIAIYKALAKNGELPVRVYAMAHGKPAVDSFLASGPEVGLFDDYLTIRSFKIYVDGALGARGAEMSEPYADAPGTSGLQQMSDSELDAFITAARSKGFQVNAHVIGDLGVERQLDAIERNGVTAAERFRLEHASIVSPRNVPRFAELGVIASMQPVFIGEYQRWGVERVGTERAAWIMPIWDLLASGAIVASGTDFPASDTGDPRHTLFALVTRRGFDGRPDGGWFPEQRIDLDTALRTMSGYAAYGAFQENETGRLTVGQHADFTVLSEDPGDIAPGSLRSIDVTLTVVGGRITFGNPK